MIWTSMDVLRLLDYRLRVCCASRPKVSGICHFDVDDAERFNFIYIIFVQIIKTLQILGLPYMWKVKSVVLSEHRNSATLIK